MSPTFTQLNRGWNADPNGPEPRISVVKSDLTLRFLLNAFQFPNFLEGEEAALVFSNCERFRLGSTNDEGWYMGQCRFSQVAPAWGEFYEIEGEASLLTAPRDWQTLSGSPTQPRHYLFYFKDETFECVATGWALQLPANKSIDTDVLSAGSVGLLSAGHFRR
jgi:hypothetical protein